MQEEKLTTFRRFIWPCTWRARCHWQPFSPSESPWTSLEENVNSFGFFEHGEKPLKSVLEILFPTEMQVLYPSFRHVAVRLKIKQNECVDHFLGELATTLKHWRIGDCHPK